MVKTFAYSYLKKEYELAFYVSSYSSNGNMAIKLILPNEEDVWGDLTVNLDLLIPGYAFVDTNNNPGIEKVIEKYGFAKPTGTTRTNGFCEYPLYEFNLDKMKPYIHPESDYFMVKKEEENA
ncbi:MAG: DUF4313 domain-containing protein [Erysipelotrichaceae bacterium]|nr:DUF4313 domain-containing protein [Erysipelotrichaceae bacterium]